MPQIVLTVSEEQAKMFAAAQRRGIEPRLVFSPPSVIPERPAHRVTPEPQMAQHADQQVREMLEAISDLLDTEFAEDTYTFEDRLGALHSAIVYEAPRWFASFREAEKRQEARIEEWERYSFGANLYAWHKDPDGGHGVTPERLPAEEVRRRLKETAQVVSSTADLSVYDVHRVIFYNDSVSGTLSVGESAEIVIAYGKAGIVVWDKQLSRLTIHAWGVFDGERDWDDPSQTLEETVLTDADLNQALDRWRRGAAEEYRKRRASVWPTR